MLVLPLPHPDKPDQHEPWCPFGKLYCCFKNGFCFVVMCGFYAC